MHSFSNNQELHIYWLATSIKLKCITSLFYFFFPKQLKGPEFYPERTDFILQTDYVCGFPDEFEET